MTCAGNEHEGSMGYVDLYPTLYLAFEVMTIRLTKRYEPCMSV